VSDIHRGRRLRHWIAVLAAAALLAGSGYLAFTAYRSHRTVSIAPSGPYAVGRQTHEWVDRSRTDQFAPLGGTPRMLSVWIWYPLAPGTSGPAAAYAPGAWHDLRKFSLGQTSLDRIRTGVLDGDRDDTLIPAPGKFPVVVLLPGLGFAAPQYQSIAASLAARGYLVAGVTPTYSANLTVLGGNAVTATAAGDPADLDGPRGDQLVSVWSADARFVADQVEVAYGAHTDPAHTVYLGHSLGGAASLEACRLDPHCSGAADLDGTPYGPVVQAGLRRPMLLLSSAAGGADTDDSAHAVFAASSSSSWAYSITGAEHFDFTDYGVYHLALPVRLLMPLGSRRVLPITTAYLGAFLDAATRGTSWTAPTYREVHPVDMLSR
jgi:dienelactone hydrolase